jgi:membrane-bound lytic murein transglycosylase D
MEIQWLISVLIISLALTTASFAANVDEHTDQPIAELAPDDAHGTSASLPVAESDPVIPPIEPSPPASRIAPSLPVDLWQRIRNGFGMAELDSEKVRSSEDFYVDRPEYIKRIVERGKRYLFHIVEEVERRGMPAEIALLPIVESAFNPRAYSNRNASGIWQFIPSTGKNYGLKQNWWYDERRDIIAATAAALDYLQNLHRMFGDWELVLASYNWGEGAVGRSLMKNRSSGLPEDFDNIALPPETRNYIPRLIAIRNIILNPAAFGIELESVPNEPYFGKVEATRHIDVRLAAKLAEISVDEFKALNPGHNRPVINIDRSRTLLFPAEKVEVFMENLKIHDRPLVSWQAYEAKKDETIEKISARYGISVGRLKEINDIDTRGAITAGQTLLVPRNGSAEGMDISVMSNKPATPKMFEHNFVYAVRKGDSLLGIAKRHDVTVGQIRSWNGSTGSLLQIGQKLTLKHKFVDKTVLPATKEELALPGKKRM